jgi:hypothetical protein
VDCKSRQITEGIMGGRGSGGHNSKGKLRDVQCARLDVHELAREGKLKLGTQGLLFGTVWFEVAGGPDAQRLVLEFPCRPASGEKSLRQSQPAPAITRVARGLLKRTTLTGDQIRALYEGGELQGAA